MPGQTYDVLPHSPDAPARPAVVEPLREGRYRVQLNASSELKRKLEFARDLTSHSNPDGDLAVVVERALDLLIDKLERASASRGPSALAAMPKHGQTIGVCPTQRDVRL